MRGLGDLRRYQVDALEFCRRTPRGYLAAKAGAGKTAVALAYMAELLWDRLEARRVLVVAPKRVVPQWAVEARRWAFSRRLTFSQYIGPRPDRLAALRASTQVVVCSFEFFPELVKEVKGSDWQFDLVVFDEASRLRNGGRRGSVGWRAMQAISSKTGSRILLMSGSPRPGTAHELFAPVFLLDQGARLGKTLTGFRSDYLEPDKQNRATGQVYSWRLRAGMEQALYGRIRDLYFAVAPDLGLDFVEVDRYVRMPSEASALYARLQGSMVVSADDLSITAGSRGVLAGKLHQLAQGAVFDDQGKVQEVHGEKLDELEQLIEEVGDRVIVCVWYTHDRDRVLARIPGAVDITTAEGLARAKRGEADVVVLHPASAGHGIDGLQEHYATMVWFAMPHSFELYDQARARIVRSGRRGATSTIYRILAAGTIDESIAQALVSKASGQDEFYRHLEGAANATA